MKKFLAVSAIAALSLGLAACGSSDTNDSVAVDNLVLNDSDTFATGNVDDLGAAPLDNASLETGNLASPELDNGTDALVNAE